MEIISSCDSAEMTQPAIAQKSSSLDTPSACIELLFRQQQQLLGVNHGSSCSAVVTGAVDKHSDYCGDPADPWFSRKFQVSRFYDDQTGRVELVRHEW